MPCKSFKAELEPHNIYQRYTYSLIYFHFKMIDTAECGKTKSCLRDPENCKDNTNCNYLVTFQKKGSEIEFSVSGKADGWIAVGFNDKPKMVCIYRLYACAMQKPQLCLYAIFFARAMSRWLIQELLHNSEKMTYEASLSYR